MAWSEWVPGSTRPDDYPSAAELAADAELDRREAERDAQRDAAGAADPGDDAPVLADEGEPYDECQVCGEPINVGDDLCTPCWLREHPRAVSR